MTIEARETYWSQFAADFEEKNNYVVGLENLQLMYDQLGTIKDLGYTLELGCGNGTYSKVIRSNLTSLIATDYSDEMLEVAKRNLSDHNNITVQKENCFALSFKDDSFDTLFMANLLHIIPTPELALKEAYRVLKKGGKLIVISYTTEGMSMSNVTKMMYRYSKTYGKPSPTAYKLTKDTAKEMVSKEGFTPHSCEILGKTMNGILLEAIK